MKKGDMIIAGLVVLVVAVGVYMYFLAPGASENAQVVIQVDGVEEHVLPLYQSGRNQQIVVTGPIGTTTVLLVEDRVRVIDSDCPDKICINRGWINRPTAPIACLPNRVIVSVVGDVDDGDIDLR